MLVEILRKGPYADFSKKGRQTTRIEAQTLDVGRRIEYPDGYARLLIDAKLAKQVLAETPPQTLPEETPQEESLEGEEKKPVRRRRTKKADE